MQVKFSWGIGAKRIYRLIVQYGSDGFDIFSGIYNHFIRYKGGAYSTKRYTLVKTIYGNYYWMSLCKVLSAF